MTILMLPLLLLVSVTQVPSAEIEFQRTQLSDKFYGEGASFGDLNADGQADIVSGPFWYEGPEFSVAHEIYAPVVHDPLHYSDNFFVFVLDLNDDGWNDIFRIGFPGQEAVWYVNPQGAEGHWTEHRIFDQVDNESPTLTDITGDGRPELICNHGGAFGYASADWDAPEKPWTFHAISPDLKKARFTHGLGVGDVNGDGRLDMLEAGGWWEQPASLDGDPQWKAHAFPFTTRGGGAQMYAYDIDGDGDADMITSLWAHGFGFSWFEQRPGEDGAQTFVEHLIMDRTPQTSPAGVSFSAVHALDLVDINGDGLLDIVTGKRHWSHGPKGDPKPHGPSVLYWFELARGAEGAHFVPHLVDEDVGVGTQVVAGDINGDGLLDIVVGNKAGTVVALQVKAGEGHGDPRIKSTAGSVESPNKRPGLPALDPEGRALNLGFESGDLADWTLEGEAFEGQPVQGDTLSPRGREASQHVGEYWMGGYEFLADAPVGSMHSAFFEVRAPWASFLVSGGDQSGLRVELVREGGQVLFSATGGNSELQKIAIADLSAHLGAHIQIRITDEATGGWGHINYDDFLFHESRPVVDAEQLAMTRDVITFSGLEPSLAAGAMTIPEGFHVDLIAAEPDLHQPIALAFDHKGRLWIAEAHSYPQRRPDGEGLDRIVVLEDLDADGSFETSTVFIDNLNLVSGLEVGLGGVWIGAAPYLYFIADRDDDLVPDAAPEIVLDGWAYEDTHETLNAFTWGPDGWLYGCHGVFTHSNVGAPGTPDEERTPINAGIWRYHPIEKQFEVFAWGTSNPWGIDFNDVGQAFATACVIPHLFHVIQGARYQRQAGSHFHPHAFSEIETIADHRHYLGDNPHGGNNRSASAGGGHAHCGAMIYLADAFPEEYRGRIFMNNVHGNRINSDSLEPAGSGYVGRHEDDFLLANDAWFRGINMKVGPDGAMYFIDWYDERACHWNEPEVWDRSNGRLYRVRYGDLAPVAVDLAAASTEELCAMQTADNDWYVRQARLRLQGLRDVESRAPLLALLSTETQVPKRLRALWALHAAGQLEQQDLLALLGESEPYLTAWAVQLLVESGTLDSAVRAEFVRLARETSSPVVRLYLASAMQRLGGDFELAEVLLAHAEDADDVNLPTLLWYGVEPLVAQDPERALSLARGAAIEAIQRFLVRRVAAQTDTRGALVTELSNTTDQPWRDLLLSELDTALRDERNLAMPAAWPAVYRRLAQDEDAQVRDQALWIAVAFQDAEATPRLTEIVEATSEDSGRRVRALEALTTCGGDGVAATLRGTLADPALRAAAIRSLASFDDPRTPPALLELYPTLGSDERASTLATLSGRESFALALLEGLASDVVPREDFSAFVLRKLRALESPAVDERLEQTWGVFRETAQDKLTLIAEFQERHAEEVLSSVRPSNGRAVYDRTCGKCHVLFGTGGELGPDLTGSNRADLEYLASNIIDPNALIGRDYQVTVVNTFDGLLLTGVLANETESSITLVTETERSVVAKEDIEERYLSQLSVMPEGQAETMDPGELRDLVAYLRGAQQVPEVVGDASSVELFNGTDLEGWSGAEEIWSVEDGTLIGRTTAGIEHNSFLVHDLEFADYRLSFDVMLVANEGNSGVQFRSRALEDGLVTGYQADIGEGWWGKLYEEHGRGLLSESAVQSALHIGGWNQYVIEVRGHHLRTWLNGELSVDLEDPEGALSGRFALQVHSGGPTEVRFRNFELGPAQD